MYMETIAKTPNSECSHYAVTWFLTDPKATCLLCSEWMYKWAWREYRKGWK